MGFRFRKTISFGKGFRLNLSRRGIGASASIPGTGLSWGVSPGRGRRSKSADAPGCVSGCLLYILIGFLGLFGLVACSVLLRSCSPDDPDRPPVSVPPSVRSLKPPVVIPPAVPDPNPVEPDRPAPRPDEPAVVDRPAPPSAAPPEEPAPKPNPSSDARALSILNLGRNHEKDRRIKQAIRCYSEVVNGFPDSIEAIDAAWRIKALGGKVVAGAKPSEIVTPKADPSARKKRLPDFSGVDRPLDSMGGVGGSPGGVGPDLCGATTKAGGSCRNPVSGGGYCYLHR